MSKKMDSLKVEDVTHETINSVVVRAEIVDWAGNVLYSEVGNDCYNRMLNKWFELDEDNSSELFLNSYDTNGHNHGIMY